MQMFINIANWGMICCMDHQQQLSWTHMFQDLGCHEEWRELHFNVQNAMKGNIAKILWVALEF